MELNRRDFLKGAALTGASAVAMGGLAACAPSGSGNAGSTADAGSGTMEYPGVTDAMDFENSVVETEEITEFAEEATYDIVVVGAGTSGLPAILTALEEGVTVGCLQKEKTAVAQGGSSTGFVLDGSTDIGLLRFIETYRERCDYRINLDLLKTYLYHSGEAIMWVNKNATEAGFPPYTTINETVRYEDESYVTKLTNRFGPKPQNNGDLVEALSELATERGAMFYYETPAVQLIVEDGAVKGVIGKRTSDNTYVKLNANMGVILATGDYQNNDSMVAKYSPDLVNFARKQWGKTGDGHLMTMLAGGYMCHPNHSKQMHDADSGPMGSEPFMAVNLDGKRFMNEEVSTDYWNNILRTNPNPAGQFCHIFDNDYSAQVSAWGGRPAPENQLLAFVPDSGVSAADGGVATGIMADLIDTHHADTLEDLADMLRIPAAALVATVEQYNEYAAAGADPDFGKQAKYLKPIATPPFWGIRRNIRITAICGGIAVDANYQAIDEMGEPIPGLYSAGFCAGDMCGAVDWSTYVVGMSCGTCMTSGRMAACHAINGSLELSNPVTWEEMSASYQNFGSGGGLSTSIHAPSAG
jgi:succinate dehydrogenase/fumarate reductase flavoprotein subunit